MGLFDWFFKSSERRFKRGGRSKGQRRHNTAHNKSVRANMKLNEQLRSQGIDPNAAFCTECKTWYDVSNTAQMNKHAH